MVEIVQSIEHASFPLELKKPPKTKIPRIYMGGKIIGIAYQQVNYPPEVRVFKIVTNKGTYYVATDPVAAYDYMEDDSSRYGNRKIEYTELQTRITIAGIEFDYEEIKKIKIGQKIGQP